MTYFKITVFKKSFSRSRKNANGLHQYLVPQRPETLEMSYYDENLPLKIIIHGYMSSVNDEIFFLLKDG